MRISPSVQDDNNSPLEDFRDLARRFRSAQHGSQPIFSSIHCFTNEAKWNTPSSRLFNRLEATELIHSLKISCKRRNIFFCIECRTNDHHDSPRSLPQSFITTARQAGAKWLNLRARSATEASITQQLSLDFSLRQLERHAMLLVPDRGEKSHHVLIWLLLVHSLGWAWDNEPEHLKVEYRARRWCELSSNEEGVESLEVPLDDTTRQAFLASFPEEVRQMAANAAAPNYFVSHLELDIFEASALAAEHLAAEIDETPLPLASNASGGLDWEATGWGDIESHSVLQQIRRSGDSPMSIGIKNLTSFKLITNIIKNRGDILLNTEVNKILGSPLASQKSNTAKSTISHYNKKLRRHNLEIVSVSSAEGIKGYCIRRIPAPEDRPRPR